MCGRFTATFTFRDLKVRFNLQGVLPELAPRYNIAPTQQAGVIVSSAGRPEVTLMRWGLVPSWAKDLAIGNRMINARGETIASKPSFKPLVERRRCLVPADGFYEWRKEGKRRVPVWIYLKSREPFAFACLWDSWRQPDGTLLRSFTIVTCSANETLRPIHDRMPAIVKPEDEEAWLDTSACGLDRAIALIDPYPAALMQTHDVSTLVNSPANDQPACLFPAAGDSETLPLFR